MKENKKKIALDVILSILVGAALCYVIELIIGSTGAQTVEVNYFTICFVVMLQIFILIRMKRNHNEIVSKLDSILKTEQREELPDEQTGE